MKFTRSYFPILLEVIILHCFTLLYMSAANARDIPCWMFGPDEWAIERAQERTLNGTPKEMRKRLIGRAPIDPETGKQACDHRIIKVEERFEDDLERPIHRPPTESPVLIDCADFEDCQSQVVTCATQRPDPTPDGWECNRDINTCPIDEGRPRWDAKANWPDISGDGWFIWCEKVIGYQPKRVPVYTVDLDEKKRLADEAEEKERLKKEKKERQSKGKKKRLTGLEFCFNMWDHPSTDDADNLACAKKAVEALLINERRKPEHEEPVE